jgi:hypothetical protein
MLPPGATTSKLRESKLSTRAGFVVCAGAHNPTIRHGGLILVMPLLSVTFHRPRYRDDNSRDRANSSSCHGCAGAGRRVARLHHGRVVRSCCRHRDGRQRDVGDLWACGRRCGRRGRVAANDRRGYPVAVSTCPSSSNRSRSRAYGTSCTRRFPSMASTAAVAAD